MASWSPLLDDATRRLREAKASVFQLQDIADKILDDELRDRIAEARSWLEAADRRLISLRLEDDDG